MTSSDYFGPLKSCSWLSYIITKISAKFVTLPAPNYDHIDNIKIRTLEDIFDLLITKEKSLIKFEIYRFRVNQDEKADYGYDLKFNFTLTGFDEETQSSIMKYDQEEVRATFNLTEDIIKKAKSTHKVFDLFVVVCMLEFKSLPEKYPSKAYVENFTTDVKKTLKKNEVKQLGCILKNPKLKDIFTGRLKVTDFHKAMFAIAIMSKNLSKLAKYFKAKYNDRDSLTPDIEADKILNYVGLYYSDKPLDILEAVSAYFDAYRLGLDCFKIAASDYLLHILKQDNINYIINIFTAAIIVQDDYLTEKAIYYFLNRFHEITRSRKFQMLSVNAGYMARIIIHSARVWISNNEVFIPGWSQTTQTTTEL